jgi:hypothetical protein
MFKNQPELKGQWKPKKHVEYEDSKKRRISIRFEQSSVRDKSDSATPLNMTPSIGKRRSTVKNTYISAVKNDKNRAPLINKPDYDNE